MITKSLQLAAIMVAFSLCFSACKQAAGGTTAETATAETATAETASGETAFKAVSIAADNTTVLGKTPDAGKSYVDETLFIGDSNTVRYMMYADENGSPFTSLTNDIGVVSMGAEAITTLKCEEFKGYKGLYTVPDSVSMLKPQRIVICYGTNNLSGSSTDATKFIETYKKGLAAITEIWPYCDLIVSAIPPLDKQRDNTKLTMTQVDAYNAAIVEMCEEEGYYFLNSVDVLKDATTGWAKKDYTLSDGVHLSKDAVTAFFEYFRTHALITEDRRPQPLGKIPTPNGSPVGLISADPIAVRGAKVPVEFVATEGGSISGSTSQYVKKGGTCSTVTAVPKTGWKFSYWTASYGSVGSGSSLTFSVPSSADAGGVIITAHFEAEEHEHDFVEVAGSRVDPTYDFPGSVKYECSICGATMTKELPKLTPAATPTPTPTPTPTATAVATTPPPATTTPPATTPPPVVITPPPATPTPTPVHVHNFSTLQSQVPATCTEAGYDVYVCSCGATENRQTSPALGHDFQGGQYCTRCGATNPDYVVPPPVEPPPAPPVEPPPAPAPEAEVVTVPSE